MTNIRLAFCSSLLLVALGARVEAQTIACAPASDSDAQLFLSGVSDLASQADTTSKLWRSSAQLPQVPAATVVFAATDSVCTRAANAAATLRGAGAQPYPVWVIAVGPDRYVVFDKERKSAGRLLAAVFDTTFTWLADFLLN